MAAADPVELTAVIGGEHRHAGGDVFDVTMPSDHAHVLGRAHHTHGRGRRGGDRRRPPGRRRAWRDMAFDDRAAIFLKVADLISGPYRDTLNGATMLGQSKTSFRRRSILPAN